MKTYLHSTALLIWIIVLIGFNLRDYATTDPWLLIEFRIPRISGSILTGFGLALSGLLMQTLFRNPLAGPFLMGVTPGASLGMAVYIFAGSALGTSYSFLGSTTSSVIGAFSALAIQLSLSRGFSAPLRLLLVGMVMGFVFSAGVQLLQQFGNEQEIQRFTFWGMGSFDQIQRGDWIYLFTPVGLVAVLTWWLRHPLDAYLLGDLYAQGSGISLKNLRVFLIFGGALLAGWITSFAGPIGFIGLVAPHIAKRLIGSESHSRVLIPTLLWGGALCLSADSLAHNLLTNSVLPLNPISALIGAPILLYGLLRAKTI